MKLKLDDKNAVVVQDGKPVYVTDEGKEVAFDAPATRDTISRLNKEAQTHREAKEALELKLKDFEGIEDAEKARKALEVLKNLDDKTLIDAGEVEKVKKEAQDAYNEQVKAIEKKYKPVLEERDSLKSSLHQERLTTAFNRSKFIQEKMAIPVDLAQARFGENFDIDDGKIIGKDASGNRVYSRSRPGEVADFDEAMEILVDSYPHRDSILKGTGASGGGAGSSGTNANGQRQITRTQFESLSPAEQATTARSGVAIVD